MEIDQRRIEEDLRGQIAGDVRCDDLFLQLYSSDASIFEVRPAGVVRPRNVQDVVATVLYAANNGISLHPRGSGSGLTGGALGRGIVLDFSRYMRRILETGADFVRVEPGVVLDQVNAHLRSRGRFFGPDPANKEITTIGSMVALDASGSHWPVAGSTRNHVRSLRTVLADGSEEEFTLQDVPRTGATTRSEQLVEGVAEILRQHEQEIRDFQPQTMVNCSGYRLDDLQSVGFGGTQINLAKLMCGSEGTLGLVTEVTLNTLPLPACANSLLLFFESIEKAARAAVELVGVKPSACDLMDRRHLTLARESDPRYEFLVPAEAEAVLLVEFQGESAEEVRSRLNETVSLIQDKAKLAFGSYPSSDEVDHDLLWQLARHYTPTLYRLKGLIRPLPFVEDIAVPPQVLPEFLHRVQHLFQQEQTTTSFFGHATHGQLHIRPFLDLAKGDDVRKIEVLADQIYEEVWRVGGTISGEHGDGMSRTPFVARQYGRLTAAFHELKQLFDSAHLLNPGKILAADCSVMTDQVRTVLSPVLEDSGSQPTGSSGPPPATLALQLGWQPEEMAHAARACNGCGLCRTHSEGMRMCPIFRFAPREEASPRAKANLARGILTGSLPPGTILEDACKEVADLCVHCHMCRLECPANVDIPKLMTEAKASYLATNGDSFHGWFMSHVDALCYYGSRYNRLANWIVGNRVARWLLEKITGIARNRKLPRFRHRSFLQDAVRRGIYEAQANAGEKVFYFVDTYANYCDQHLAEAFLSVLEHNEISVCSADTQLPSAMPMIARGKIASARAIAEQNVALLVEAVRRGYKIIATEPSAALALTHEYPILLPGDSDAELVAANTYEACHYLWNLHQLGRLRLDFQPLNISLGYHVPCHTKALEIGAPAEHLLKLIPELRVERLEKGCSGIAGMYGFQREYYRSSLRAGLPLVNAVRNGPFALGATECSTCKVQMEQSSTKPTIHPIKLVALAYGLMPELRQLIDSPGTELVVT